MEGRPSHTTLGTHLLVAALTPCFGLFASASHRGLKSPIELTRSEGVAQICIFNVKVERGCPWVASDQDLGNSPSRLLKKR